MGYRGVIAYDNGEMITVTTVHSSIDLHNDIKCFMKEKKECEGELFSFQDFAEGIFGNITLNSHVHDISMMDDESFFERANSGLYFNSSYRPVSYCRLHDKYKGIVYLMCSEYVKHYGDAEKYYSNTQNIEEIVRNHEHAQDGISAYYSKGDDTIHFYIDSCYLDENKETIYGKKFFEELNEHN